MTEVVNLDRIQAVLKDVDVVGVIDAGFRAYSRGEVVVPPVGELCFEDPPGEAHIKYGYIKNDPFYVIKIASGFYHNPALGLSSSQGLMLVFCQKTGILKAVLLDNGYLTDIRTSAAGAVVANYMAPGKVNRIGILGAGVQARLQLSFLRSIIDCNQVLVWTTNQQRKEAYQGFFEREDLVIAFTGDCREIAATCNYIVTATPSKAPLLKAEDIRPGTHITAVGSDTAEKIELDPKILGRADLVVVDSLSQSKMRGEVYRATRAGTLEAGRVRELGGSIMAGKNIRTSESQISVADLTGVAVQDIQIAKAVYQRLHG